MDALKVVCISATYESTSMPVYDKECVVLMCIIVHGVLGVHCCVMV